MKKTALRNWFFCILVFAGYSAFSQTKPDTLYFKPFIWMSEPPADCPFVQSKELTGIKFLGIKSGFHVVIPGILHGPTMTDCIPRLPIVIFPGWTGEEILQFRMEMSQRVMVLSALRPDRL